uniref:Uncharacterized protein n=2 Tax=viral metagenome TaxID=1070528 RepID=A0A6M3X5M6_9ZZZZ
MAKPQKAIISYECPDCHAQFVGSECPECGGSKGKIKLAKDGLPQNMHKPNVLFGDIDDLAPSRSIIDNDDFDFLKKRAQYQNEQTMDNLRESMLTKSEIKNAELKRDLLKSRAALEQFDPMPNGPNSQGWSTAYPPKLNDPIQQNNPSIDQGQQFQGMFSAQSPQSLFMNKFLNMKPDQRSELLEQVSNADPSAIQALSSMMTSPQPQAYPNMMQPGMMNPYLMQNMIPQQVHEQNQIDPTETAVRMMSQMFEMFKQMQPPQDNGIKDTLNEFKTEINKIHEKFNSISNRGQSHEEQIMRSELNELKQLIQSSSSKPGIIEQVRDLKNLIGELEENGLMNKGGPNTTVDDTIRLKEAAHKIEIENRKLSIEEEQMKTKESKNSLQKQFAQALFQKELQKSIKPVEEPSVGYHNIAKYPMQINPKTTSPKVIVSEHFGDSGSIQETREPVSKEVI